MDYVSCNTPTLPITPSGSALPSSLEPFPTNDRYCNWKSLRTEAASAAPPPISPVFPTCRGSLTTSHAPPPTLIESEYIRDTAACDVWGPRRRRSAIKLQAAEREVRH